MTLPVVEVGEAARNRDAQPDFNPSRTRLIAIWFVQLMLVMSVLPWRRDELFDGGLDPTVVGKALVAVGALLGAALIARATTRRYPIGVGPAALAALVVLISLLGALVAEGVGPTVVLAIRVAILVATVLLLLSGVSWEVGVGSLLAAMGTVAVIAGVTGVPGALADGRLGGGVPELHPNPLAELAGAPLVGLTVRMLRRGVRLPGALSFLLLLAIVIGTGSRTAFVALGLALLTAVVVNGIRDRTTVYLMFAAAPLLYAMAVLTEAIQELATRAGSTDTTSTLEARFDAWRVVLGWSWATWEKWIGLGLATKTVPVNARWHDEQVLDSSWISILAQAGLMGAVFMGMFVIWCVITAGASVQRRSLVLPLLVLVIVRSVTESGLLGGAMPFVQLMLLATVLTRRSRHDGPMRRGESRASDCSPEATSNSSSMSSEPRALGERSMGER